MRPKNGFWILTMALMWTGAALAQGDTFGGRVVAGVEAADIRVALEGENGRPLVQTMTDGRGSFRFTDLSGVGNANDGYAYLTVREEGYKPYRERLDWTQIRGGGVFTIFLEPEDGAAIVAEGAVDIRQLLADIPEDAVEEYQRALEDAADGDHDDAAERLERVVEMAPDFYDAWIDLGNQYSELGETEDAFAAYEQAAVVNPNGALAHVNLGALRYQEGERLGADQNGQEAMAAFTAARASLEQALELDPRSVEAHFFLGATLYRMTRYGPAEDALLEAIEIAGQHAQARLTLINVYARLQRYDAALEQANAFLDENPDAPERDSIERVRNQLEDALGL